MNPYHLATKINTWHPSTEEKQFCYIKQRVWDIISKYFFYWKKVDLNDSFSKY